MNKKETINKILVVLAEEAKKIKKKKSLVATPILRRPMGSFSILGVSEELNESDENVVYRGGDEGNFYAKSFDYAKSFGEVKKFVINSAKIFDINNKAHFDYLLKKEDGKIIFDGDNSIFKSYEDFISHSNGDIIAEANNSWIAERYSEVIRNAGYDIIKFQDGGNKSFLSLNNDAIIPMGKSSNHLKESRSIIKPITKKFDNLKWKLNDYQKQLLDDFISVPDEQLRESDYEYISKRTDIPAGSIKSIKNTYADKRSSEEIKEEQIKIQKGLGIGSGDETMMKMIEKDALEQISAVRDLPKSNSGKAWSMNPHPEFRNKSQKEISYNAGSVQVSNRRYERKLPDFMFEWLMYFIEGSEKVKIQESKILDDLHSEKLGDNKRIKISLDTIIKESGAHPYDIGSNTKVKDIQELNELLKEFNETFGTNFITANQYTGEDGFLKVIMENEQTVDKYGKNILNKKLVDMTHTEEKRGAEFLKTINAMSSMGFKIER